MNKANHNGDRQYKSAIRDRSITNIIRGGCMKDRNTKDEP